MERRSRDRQFGAEVLCKWRLVGAVEKKGDMGKYIPRHSENFSGFKFFRCFHIRIGKLCSLYKVERGPSQGSMNGRKCQAMWNSNDPH